MLEETVMMMLSCSGVLFYGTAIYAIFFNPTLAKSFIRWHRKAPFVPKVMFILMFLIFFIAFIFAFLQWIITFGFYLIGE